MRQQCTPDSLSSKRRINKQILQIQSWLREERAVVVEEQCEARWTLANECKHHFRARSLTKQRLRKKCLGGHTLMCQLLVFSEHTNEAKNERYVGRCSGAERGEGLIDGHACNSG